MVPFFDTLILFQPYVRLVGCLLAVVVEDKFCLPALAVEDMSGRMNCETIPLKMALWNSCLKNIYGSSAVSQDLLRGSISYFLKEEEMEVIPKLLAGL